MDSKTLLEIFEYFLIISFVIVSLALMNLCLFEVQLPEFMMAKALPLSVLSVAFAIMFHSVSKKNGDGKGGLRVMFQKIKSSLASDDTEENKDQDNLSEKKSNTTVE